MVAWQGCMVALMEMEYMYWEPIYKKAVLIKEITGSKINTIPIGTEFEVVVNMIKGIDYSSCRGLPVNQVYNNEFKLIEFP